jgi:hypothetical protein
MKHTLFLIAAAGMVALGWWLRGRLAPAPSACEVPSVTRDTIKGDSIPYEVPVPVPAVRYVALAPDTVFIGVDTAAILLAYFAENLYADTLMNDTSAFIALSEAVTQNRIAERTLTFQNRRPTYITTTIVQQQQPTLQLYAGVVAGKGLTAPVVQLGYKRWVVGAGYNLSGGGVVGGVGYRIR